MAEIHVEPARRGRGWLLIVLALVAAGALAYYFLVYRGSVATTTTTMGSVAVPSPVSPAGG